ncbi:uncharacterized protein LOC144712680 [Wolffia australiana]
MNQFYAYHFMVRDSSRVLHLSARLFQEYVVDAYAKVEESRLHWIRCNQATLLSGLYRGLVDQVATDDVAVPTGRMIILPPSFTSGPRYMKGLYQDVMAILKLKELLNLIIEKEIFGKVNGRVYVIKFQKRDPNDKDLFDCVTTHMIHGPCGSTNPRCPCMKEGKCSKKFPEEFIGSTQVNNDGYPLCLRRNNGRVIQKGSHLIDNRWVVPYNKYLCKVFNSHINVEICSSIQLVKYLYKYVYKGYDRIQVRVSSNSATTNFAIGGNVPNASSRDEAQQYLDARYHAKNVPNHLALQVHDDNMQTVVYVEGATCYEELRTIAGVIYDTYQRAAAARGLLHFDAEFDNDLALTSGITSPRQVGEFFAMMLLYCEISNPVVLLEKYLEAMSEDIHFNNSASQVTNQIQKKVLSAIESILYHNGSSLAAFPGFPQSVEIQLIVFETIELTECAKEAKVFFDDGPGGSGKTFLY